MIIKQYIKDFEAVVGTRPSGIEVDGEEGDFIMN